MGEVSHVRVLEFVRFAKLFGIWIVAKISVRSYGVSYVLRAYFA